MKVSLTLILAGVACLDPLPLAGAPQLQAAETVKEFNVIRIRYGKIVNFVPGEITITDTAIHFEGSIEKYSFDVPLRDISEIKRHDKLKLIEIDVKKGENYKFCVFEKKTDAAFLPNKKCGAPIEPFVDALSAAISPTEAPPPQPARESSPPKHFAPIPVPEVAVDAAPDPAVVAGQSTEQVRSALGPPDKIVGPASAAEADGVIVTWIYKGVRITFTGNKVSGIEPQDKPVRQ